MARYIDVNKLKKDLKELTEQERIEYMGIYDVINSQPTVDMLGVKCAGGYQPVHTGKTEIPTPPTTGSNIISPAKRIAIEEVKHGEWVTATTGLAVSNKHYYCSVCHRMSPANAESKYCPNCGIKMKRSRRK